jgi:3-hydroxyisobutyrate dehydrogenase
VKISFIGLGVMGFNMAGHLANANLDIVAYNRTASKAIKWSNTFNKKSTSNFDEIIADIIILCVSKDEDVQNIVNEICPKMQKDTIIIDHSTISHTCAIKMSKLCEKYNVKFIDAPISGGEEGAKKGILTVMAGCNETTLKTISPILSHYAKNITAMGKVGDGQLTKMVNQILICGTLQGLSEGLSFAKKHNLDKDKIAPTLSGGAAGSWQLQNRATSMLKDKFNFGFAIDLMIKDLTYSINESKHSGLDLPILEKTLNQYKKLSSNGYGNLDTSALIKAIENLY